MQTKRTERQQHFLNLASIHADDFRARVAQHDQESSFPHENVAAMKASGYTALLVPEELGGGGASPLDLAFAQERLAYGDLPMAIAVNMHHIAVAMIADLWRLNQQGAGLKLEGIEPMLRAVVKDKIIFGAPVSDPKMNSSLGFAGVNDTTRQARKVAGGYVINGRSGFGTMSACADYLLTTARYHDPVEGPRCLLCFLPSTTKGVQIQNNWDTMSIRSSCSNDVVWDNVFIEEKATVSRPVQTWDALSNLTSSWWVASGPACYIGLAQAARDYAMNWISGRTQEPFEQPMTYYPGNQLLAAEMEIGLRSARATLHHTIAAHDDLATRSADDLVNLIACFQFVMESCVQVVDRAMRMVGGAALFKKSPLEQMYRDVRAAIIHQPFAGTEGKALLGRRAFGLPVYGMPRFV
ncbi:MAG: acyl-CoA/acyl-ACP dehydrogenase [Deltaproteobacteria bacterium]|nr:acyl-CoA/acyl-ACP dehydrogenase [Deltaproteobacteria bacterium]